jgi:hypothetical protein
MGIKKGQAPANAQTLGRASIVGTPGKKSDNSAQSSPAQLSIVIEPSPSKPGYFISWDADRSAVICVSRSPFVDSARCLVSGGNHPNCILEMRHAGRSDVSLRARLGHAAGLVVEEGAHGPVFRAIREGSPGAVAASWSDLKAEPASIVPMGAKNAR